jgi:hypothetical protein
MTPARHLDDLGRRLAWLVLLVAVLLARGLTPDGWMPVASASGGIELAVCNGLGPEDRMVLTPDGKIQRKAPAQGQAGDHPCAFAGIGIADTPPPVAIAAMPIDRAASLPPALAAATMPGRGLAAPPPPATGPPALA